MGQAKGTPTRRDFIRLAAALVLVPTAPAVLQAQQLLQAWRDEEHPEPRPGIDGSKVVPADQLRDPELIELFDGIRQIPHIADGIRCYCGCARIEGYRSLLICYEPPGMSRYCLVCQGQGRLAVARWKEGQTLDQIRRATDARYGSGAEPSTGHDAGSCAHQHAHDHHHRR